MVRQVGIVVLLLLLAGCTGSSSSKGAEEEGDKTAFDDLDLDATDTTGIIRGIVVDDRITPLADALVSLKASDGDRETTTDAEGRFGFDELPGGTYFLSASKLNYESVQTVVEVVAGEDEPTPARLLLTRLFTIDPFSFTTKFEGFIQCGYQVLLLSSLCFNDYETLLVPDIPPTLKEVFDNRGYVTSLDGNWSTLVFELTWEPSASGTSPEMFVLVSFWNRTSSDFYGNVGGPPPVVTLRLETGEVHPNSQGCCDRMIPPEGLPDLYATPRSTSSRASSSAATR